MLDMKFHDLITDRVSFVYVPMKFLNVVVKNFIKSFYAKELCLLLKPYLELLSLHSYVLSVLFRLSLVEYFCTQGSLTLVAGEAHEQICFGSCCMTVVTCDDDK